jgi:hypothetical protein
VFDEEVAELVAGSFVGGDLVAHGGFLVGEGISLGMGLGVHADTWWRG